MSEPANNLTDNTSGKWVAFDFDGTIADTKAFLVELYNSRLSKEYGGITIDPSEISLLRAMSLPKILSHLKISPFRLPFFVRAARREIGLNIARIPLIPGMAEQLDALAARGFSVAVISSNNAENIEAFLKMNGITVVSEIACDIGASLWVKFKTIHRFMKKHRIAPANIVYVGDEIRDITACRREGVRIVAVPWGFDPSGELRDHHPDALVVEPGDLVGCISEMLL